MEFKIKYRIRYIDLCNEFGDTKTETVINSNGQIHVRHWNHCNHGNRYCLIKRAKGKVTCEFAEELYRNLLGMIVQNGQLISSPNIDAEINLEQKGIKISLDGEISVDGKTYISLMDKYLESVDLNWETV